MKTNWLRKWTKKQKQEKYSVKGKVNSNKNKGQWADVDKILKER